MRVDRMVWGELGSIAGQARAIEAEGFDGLIAAEVNADPFPPLTIAAEHTERVDLMTAITVAFARSPMTLAQVGHDLNQYSRGRIILGLGSQIRAHITGRFSMPWSKPAARMREYVQAMRAIWACWNEGEQLDFRGEFYQHTLMTPNFMPPESRHGAPKVFLAAVGPRMTEVAGEVADGMIAHGFTTERYMREVTLPSLELGFERAGRSRADFQLSCPLFLLSTDDDATYAARRAGLKRQIAFYGSTPAYRPVLELHGWGDLQTELNRLSKAGKWVEMGEEISDEIVAAFAVEAPAEQLVHEMLGRYGDMVDRMAWGLDLGDPDLEREQIAKLRAG
ncbi:MAG: TIGR03617 family F420-dependent LLM class oxidoreductase [Myxococcota bacterium]|nr:TIGR03617 family F420-dependent LLM class oxidoreductase [Myxococcota bacterium]